MPFPERYRLHFWLCRIRNRQRCYIFELASSFPPLRFQFSLQKDRDRANQQTLIKHSRNLRDAMDNAALFLTIARWKEFWKDLTNVVSLCNREDAKLQVKNRVVQRSQNKTDRSDKDNISEPRYIEKVAKKNAIPASYVEIDRQLSDAEEFEAIFLSATEIDRWRPHTLSTENSSQRSSCRHKWFENLQLSNPTQAWKWTVGGIYPDMCIMWKLGDGMEGVTQRD